MKDTDEALAGGDASVITRAFDAAQPLLTETERTAAQAWIETVDAAGAIEPTGATKQYERDLIGHILAEPAGFVGVAGLMKPEHFAQPELTEVCRVMHELDREGKPLGRTPIIERLGSSKVQANWHDVLGHCVSVHTTTMSPRQKAEAVFGLWRNRTLAALGAALFHRAKAAQAQDAPSIIDDLSSRLVDLEVPADGRTSDIGVGEAASEFRADMQARIERGQQLPGISTGLPKLDYYLGGLMRGGLYIGKAETGIGKTAFALSIAKNIALRASKSAIPEEQVLTAIVSLEMMATHLALRVLANVASVDGMSMRLGRLTPVEIDNVLKGERELAHLNEWLRLNHNPGMTVAGVKRYLQRLAIRFGRRPGLVIIDYVQLLRGEGRTREQEVAEISTSLKNMSKELDCAVLCLSQVNEEGRARESRRLEHDADAIIHLQPDSEDSGADEKFIYDLVIPKNRFGSTVKKGDYKVLFMRRFQRIVETADWNQAGGW